MRCCVGIVLAACVGAARADGDAVLEAIGRGDCAQAGALINEGIGRNEADAYFGAGYLYASTGCVVADLSRAARYYQRAIELGSNEARAKLGFMYGMGVGVPQDFRAACHWYTFPIAGMPATTWCEPSKAIAYGYARTVQEVAGLRFVYPAPRIGGLEEGTLYVTFHTATGALTYASVATDGRRNPKKLSRQSAFRLAIDRAYEEALGVVPKPDDLPKEDLAFESPWTFALR